MIKGFNTNFTLNSSHWTYSWCKKKFVSHYYLQLGISNKISMESFSADKVSYELILRPFFS